MSRRSGAAQYKSQKTLNANKSDVDIPRIQDIHGDKLTTTMNEGNLEVLLM